VVLVDFGEARCTVCNARFFFEWASSMGRSLLDEEIPFCPFCGEAGIPRRKKEEATQCPSTK